MIDQTTGHVLNAPQLGWRDVRIREALAHELKLPVFIENAPIACALSQLWFGQSGIASTGDFVYVTVGDGVGAAIVVNGEVLRGQGNTAGEFGHLPLSFDGPHCLCGSTGCLEAYTSNLATISRYLGQELSPTMTRTLLHESGLTVDDVIARARAHDQRALDALEATGRYLGLGIASIVTALNPKQIFVGGEITAAWDLIEPAILRAIASRALTKSAAETMVIPDPASGHPRLRGGVTLVSARRFAAPRLV
jgi:predicted NBD/HSP70 family sugar kinase